MYVSQSSFANEYLKKNISYVIHSHHFFSLHNRYLLMFHELSCLMTFSIRNTEFAIGA